MSDRNLYRAHNRQNQGYPPPRSILYHPSSFPPNAFVDPNFDYRYGMPPMQCIIPTHPPTIIDVAAGLQMAPPPPHIMMGHQHDSDKNISAGSISEMPSKVIPDASSFSGTAATETEALGAKFFEFISGFVDKSPVPDSKAISTVSVTSNSQISEHAPVKTTVEERPQRNAQQPKIKPFKMEGTSVTRSKTDDEDTGVVGTNDKKVRIGFKNLIISESSLPINSKLDVTVEKKVKLSEGGKKPSARVINNKNLAEQRSSSTDKVDNTQTVKASSVVTTSVTEVDKSKTSDYSTYSQPTDEWMEVDNKKKKKPKQFSKHSREQDEAITSGRYTSSKSPIGDDASHVGKPQGGYSAKELHTKSRGITAKDTAVQTLFSSTTLSRGGNKNYQQNQSGSSDRNFSSHEDSDVRSYHAHSDSHKDNQYSANNRNTKECSYSTNNYKQKDKIKNNTSFHSFNNSIASSSSELNTSLASKESSLLLSSNKNHVFVKSSVIEVAANKGHKIPPISSLTTKSDPQVVPSITAVSISTMNVNIKHSSESSVKHTPGVLPVQISVQKSSNTAFKQLNEKSMEYDENDRYSLIGFVRNGRLSYTVSEILSLKDCRFARLEPEMIQRIRPELLSCNRTDNYGGSGSHLHRHGQWNNSSRHGGRGSGSHGAGANTLILKTNCPWMKKKDQMKSMTGNELEEEKLMMFIRSSLNKLSDTTLNVVSQDVLDGPLDTKKNMEKFVQQLHQKAVQDVKYISLYARLAKAITKSSSERLAITKKQFEADISNMCISLKRDFEIEKTFDPKILEANRDAPNIEALITLLYEKEVSYKQKHRGNVEFLAALYLENLINYQVIIRYIDSQMKACDEFSVELLCRLLTLAGKVLEKHDKSIVQRCFDHFVKHKTNLPSKINYRVADLRDLQKKEWLTDKDTAFASDSSAISGISSTSGSSLLACGRSSTSTSNNAGKPDWRNGSSGGRNAAISMNSYSRSSGSGYDKSGSAGTGNRGGYRHSFQSNQRHSTNNISSGGRYEALSPMSRSSISSSTPSSGTITASNVATVRKSRFINSKTMPTPDSVISIIDSSFSKSSGFTKASASTKLSTNEGIDAMSVNITDVSSLSKKELKLKMELDTLKMAAKTLVTELCSNNDVETADACIMSCDLQLNMYLFVNTAIDIYLEENVGHLPLGTYFLHLLQTSLLKFPDLYKGLELTISLIEDLSIDVPSAYERLALILIPLLCHNKINLAQVYDCMLNNDVSEPSRHVIRCLRLIHENLSVVDCIYVWCSSNLSLDKLVPACSHEMLTKNGLEFILSPSENLLQTSNFATLKQQRSVHQLLTDDNISSSQVLKYFLEPAYYAHDSPALYVARSITFGCPFGGTKLIKTYITNLIESNLPLFLWMCEEDKTGVISMLINAHELTHHYKHVPYGFLSSFTECLLTSLSDTIKKEDVENVCSHRSSISSIPAAPSGAGTDCKVFQSEISKGISAFCRSAMNSGLVVQVFSEGETLASNDAN